MKVLGKRRKHQKTHKEKKRKRGIFQTGGLETEECRRAGSKLHEQLVGSVKRHCVKKKQKDLESRSWRKLERNRTSYIVREGKDYRKLYGAARRVSQDTTKRKVKCRRVIQKSQKTQSEGGE